MPIHRAFFLLVAAAGLAACQGSTEAAASAGAPRALWTRADPAGGNALPHADSGIAVFTTAFDRRVVALDARTGEPRWDRRLEGGPRGANLPLANVLAFEGSILVPGWDLYALDRATGSVRWRYAPPGEFPAAAPIALAGGRIFSPGSLQLHAVDARTGTAAWVAPLGERPFAPVVEGGVVYLGTRGLFGVSNALGAGHAVAIDAADGRVLWKTPIPDEPGTPWPGGIDHAGALTPELFVVSSNNGRVYGIERSTGRVRWSHRGPGPYESGVAIVEGVAVAASLTGEIVGLDAATGAVKWRASTGGSSVTEQITTDGRCAYVSVGTILCVDASGRVRWSHGGDSKGGPSYSTPARVVDGRLYAGSLTGFHSLALPR